MHFRARDPISALTHLLGVLLSVVATFVLVHLAVSRATPRHAVSFAVFGVSLVLLYTASTVYHFYPGSLRVVRIFRRIDHTMIYVLIAGSYTPICLVPLNGRWGWSLLAVIWSMAALSILAKNLWFTAPRWLYTVSYLAMGWAALAAIGPISRQVPPGGIAWLAVGGVFYSVGAVFYMLKRPNLSRWFGFHELFHVFVLAGSFSHFWMVFRYILYL